MTTASNPVAQAVETKLRETLKPIHFELIDNSWKHKGHPGNVTGGSHLSVVVVSEVFEGMATMERHRHVRGIIKDELANHIHALELKALPPRLWQG